MIETIHAGGRPTPKPKPIIRDPVPVIKSPGSPKPK